MGTRTYTTGNGWGGRKQETHEPGGRASPTLFTPMGWRRHPRVLPLACVLPGGVRSHLPRVSSTLPNSIESVSKAFLRRPNLNWKRFRASLNSMHDDIKVHTERILNEELGLAEHEWKWKTAIPVIGRAEGIVKRNNQKKKTARPPTIDPPDPIITAKASQPYESRAMSYSSNYSSHYRQMPSNPHPIGYVRRGGARSRVQKAVL